MNDIGSQFVWRTADRPTYRRLLGSYVNPPHWSVRVASFSGDVVERAEEWQVEVAGDGSILRVRHQLPQGRPGAALEEPQALVDDLRAFFRDLR